MVTPCGRILALVTCKRLATTVHYVMCFEVGSICGRIVAKVTHIRLLSSVNENMPLELVVTDLGIASAMHDHLVPPDNC